MKNTWVTQLLLVSLIAVCFEAGQLFAQKRSFQKEFEITKANAEKGQSQAQFQVGMHYAFGDGVKPNPAEAVKWYRKAAEQGFVKAQSTLGECYEDGMGITKDVSEAVKWYRKAAEHSIESGTLLCQLLWREKKRKGSRVWYRKAVEQGNPIAQFNLGGCYFTGQGVDKNLGFITEVGALNFGL